MELTNSVKTASNKLQQPFSGTLIDDLLATVEKIQTEQCPFCNEGHDPYNFQAKCPFCHGTMRLKLGEAAEISERSWEESRA